jgi:hypothetical protein
MYVKHSYEIWGDFKKQKTSKTNLGEVILIVRSGSRLTGRSELAKINTVETVIKMISTVFPLVANK